MLKIWLRNYLNNRKQYAEIRNNKSSLTYAVCGVQQGSSHGPMLVIIYIDICNISKNLNSVLYVDNTTFYTT